MNSIQTILMMTINLKDGDFCKITAGTHKGKSGFVRDINKSKTGHITITVLQKNGVRFKTLGKNAEVTIDE
jgi:ribosomal protein S4E